MWLFHLNLFYSFEHIFTLWKLICVDIQIDILNVRIRYTINWLIINIIKLLPKYYWLIIKDLLNQISFRVDVLLTNLLKINVKHKCRFFSNVDY